MGTMSERIFRYTDQPDSPCTRIGRLSFGTFPWYKTIATEKYSKL